MLYVCNARSWAITEGLRNALCHLNVTQMFVELH